MLLMCIIIYMPYDFGAVHVYFELEFFFAACRCNFLLNNVIDKILLLTKRREKYLVVGAVRFVRTILSRHVSLSSRWSKLYLMIISFSFFI